MTVVQTKIIIYILLFTKKKRWYVKNDEEIIKHEKTCIKHDVKKNVKSA